MLEARRTHRLSFFSCSDQLHVTSPRPVVLTFRKNFGSQSAREKFKAPDGQSNLNEALSIHRKARGSRRRAGVCEALRLRPSSCEYSLCDSQRRERASVTASSS